MHGIGTKPRLIPEKYLAARGASLAGNLRENSAPPFLDRLGIALVGALQRLLRRQPQLGEQFADRSHAKPDGKLPLNQIGTILRVHNPKSSPY